MIFCREAGQNVVPGRHADRIGRVGFGKVGPFSNKPVQVRRLHMRISGSSQGVETLLIRHQQKNIGTGIRRVNIFSDVFVPFKRAFLVFVFQ